MRRKTGHSGSEATLSTIDRHVGARIRARRRELGLSQAALGEKAGVASQQIAKYETGENGVPASRLWMIARAISLGAERLFEGLDARLAGEADDLSAGPEPSVRRGGVLDDSDQLAEAFRRISNPRTRELLMVLSRELAAKE